MRGGQGVPCTSRHTAAAVTRPLTHGLPLTCGPKHNDGGVVAFHKLAQQRQQGAGRDVLVCCLRSVHVAHIKLFLTARRGAHACVCPCSLLSSLPAWCTMRLRGVCARRHCQQFYAQRTHVRDVCLHRCMRAQLHNFTSSRSVSRWTKTHPTDLTSKRCLSGW